MSPRQSGNGSMLVKFNSSVGSLSMFGDVAVELLRMAGHSGTVPSAILAADLPQALTKLETAIAKLPPDARARADMERKDDGVKVTLRQRAHPLIQLGRRAADAGVDLLWDKA